MARASAQSLTLPAGGLLRPILVACGAAVVAFSTVIMYEAGIGGSALYFPILLVAILAASGAVYISLRKGLNASLEVRTWAILPLLATFFLCLFGAHALHGEYSQDELDQHVAARRMNPQYEPIYPPDNSWDSIATLLFVMACIAIVGVALVLLPAIGRKIVISFLVLFHFLGIVTAVTAVPAGNYVPWLPTVVWRHVYRPYLSFMYLNNAYHFYSPEPGPPTLVWFRLEYELPGNEDVDKTELVKWIKLADRKDFATRLQYQRMLALTESINKPDRTVPYSKIIALGKRRLAIQNGINPLTPEQEKGEAPVNWSDDSVSPQMGRRVPEWWRTDEEPKNIDLPIGIDWSQQYQPPDEMATMYLKSYVDHVAQSHDGLEKYPNAKLKHVQVYKIIHRLPTPYEISEEMSPLDPTTHLVYYYGRYVPNEGDRDNWVLKRPRMDPEDAKRYPGLATMTYMTQQGMPRNEPLQDMYLYWLLPIQKLPKEGIRNPKMSNDDHWILTDGLKRHTGDPTEMIWDRE